MFNAKCLLILTLLASVICFGCGDRTSQMMKPVVDELLVEEPVSIPDPGLRAAIAEALNKAPGDTITRADMETLVVLWAVGRDITDLRGIEFAINLTELVLWDNSISDISLLASLTNLTNDLQLGYNSISDISPLASLTNLTSLGLRYNNISDISPLASLTNLTVLNLWDNSISDISPLAKLTQLTWLRLNRNNISDVSPIVRLNLTGTETDSTGLDITGNPLSYAAINTHIPAMQARGIEVEFDELPVEEPLVEEPERQFTPFEGLTISDDGTVSLVVGRAIQVAGPGRCIFFDGGSLNGVRFDVHDFFWAYRADDNSDFRAIEGTESDQGICGYKALTEPGQYRVFLDFSMNGNRHDAVSQNVIEIK